MAKGRGRAKAPAEPGETLDEGADEHTGAGADEDGAAASRDDADTADEPSADDAEVAGHTETEGDDAESSNRGPVPVADRGDDKASIARFDPLAAYLREVQRHPLLTAEETQTLAQDFVSTQDAAKAARLVTANLRLVVKIAYEYRRAYKNILDLIQEGNIGLMQAVKRYDPYRGVKLSSYAAWWIRAYILRFILNNWRLVKLGTTQAQRKLFFNLRKKRAELVAMGIEPTDAEVAKRLDVPESDVAEMEVRLQASERSLDAPIGDGEGRATAKIDTMPSSVEGPDSLVADHELQGLLKEKLAAFRATLDGKDKDLAIFDQRLVADEPLTLQQLGDRFGISRERVRQLEQRLTGKLRDYLREEMGDAVEVA
ncbi:MAG: sigma-70 family RNA polymerase sigma factor [Polyangiaceae bacterium]